MSARVSGLLTPPVFPGRTGYLFGISDSVAQPTSRSDREPMDAGPSASSNYHLDLAANGPTVSATLRQAEQMQLIQAALESMDDEVSATIVRLHFFDGLSLRQVAGRLSLSYDKVRDRYAAGMRRLERELGSLQ